MVKLPVLVTLQLSALVCSAQTDADTSFTASASNYTKQLFYKEFIAAHSINTGSEYVEYDQLNDEHPYFVSDDWTTGSIVYDDDLFENVEMLYDLSSQVVVVEHYSSASKIALVNKKVDRFTVHGHTFIKLEKAAGFHNTMSSGFYDLLYEGQTKLIASRRKQHQERVSSGEIEAEFDEINRYYLLKNNNYFLVKNKRALITLLSDKKQPIRQFIRRSKIKFASNRENALVRITEFYDTLPN